MVLDSFTHFCLHCLLAVIEGSEHPHMVEKHLFEVYPPYEDA